MAEKPTIDFWFSVGSTYSYLAIMRLAAVEKATGVTFVWRPFSVRVIMREMENIPFANKPVKAAYMWRDVGRRAAAYGLAPTLPAPYPLKQFDRLNRIAVLAAAEGWCPAYVRAVYRRWFEAGTEPETDADLSACIAEAGKDPARILALAETPAAVAAYETATDEARKLGIFGSPTFVVDGELFWGDDRLDDAIAWRRHGRLAKP